MGEEELRTALRCFAGSRKQSQAAEAHKHGQSEGGTHTSSSEDVLTLCRVWPLTGRTHQIRVHMQLLGSPLIGDYKYDQRQHRNWQLACPRLFLHCLRVRLYDTDGNNFDVFDELHDDLSAVLLKLRPVEVDADALQSLLCRS